MINQYACVFQVAPTMEWDGSDPIIYQPLPKKTEVVWLNDIHNGDELVLVFFLYICCPASSHPFSLFISNITLINYV